MKVYIAGKITGLDNYKELFAEAEKEIKAAGHVVMNPAILPDGFDYEDYMKICFAMIDVCGAVYFLSNWQESAGAIREKEYAEYGGKKLVYQVNLSL